MKPVKLLALIHIALTFIVRVQSQTQSPRTENVFIVVIDGIRNNEGFEAGSRNMPFIWDSLRPKGTVYSNFFNRGITVTNSGHSTIVTGVRQLLLNNDAVVTPLRPKEPTLGEYYRKSLSVPKEKVYYISGKNTIWRYPVSLYPGYGYQYAPTIVLTSHDDLETWDSTRAIMNRSHPSLAYVLFAQVDFEGHTGDTSKYIGAIRQVDSLIYLLWKKIQSDPIYRDKTTMIVTSDHGRHDDQHGGWKSHGDYCHGCRHIPFFAIGPEIRSGAVISQPRDHIDIAPTVAYLLGFSATFAQGTVMSEMIRSYQSGSPEGSAASTGNMEEMNISRSPGFSRSCDVAVDRKGIHVVYSDNSRGSYEIYYSRGTDGGDSWTQPTVIFPTVDGSYTDPVITVADDSVLFVATEGYQYMPTLDSYVWMLKGRRSTDSGNTWGAEMTVDTSKTVSCKPAISSGGNRIDIVSSKYTWLGSNLSRDGGLTFERSRSVGLGGHPQAPSCAFADTTCYAVWQNVLTTGSPYWNIWFNREPWKSVETTVTNNGTTGYSYAPSIASNRRDVLHLCYADLPNSAQGNVWGIEYRRSVGLGFKLSLATRISGNHIGFAPAVKVSSNGKIWAVWVDYSSNQYSIWGSYSGDGGLIWTEPYQVTSLQSYAADPALAVVGDTLLVVWQDMRSGNWDIFFEKVPLSALSAVQPDPTKVPRQTTLFQNYPNPFNPATTIEFALPQPGHVKIKIYNVLGQEIVALVNEQLETGTYRAKWDASGLPSGMYFCHFEYGNLVEIRKLMLMR